MAPPPPAQERLSQIRDLVNQWEQLIGFSISVPDWAVNEMAAQLGIASLYDVGQYMWHHQGTGGAAFVPVWYSGAMPWAQYGTDAATYQMKFNQAQAEWETLTGQSLSQDQFHYFMGATSGQLTGSDVQSLVMNDPRMLETYGWLKFGLNHQQFEQQRQSMQLAYGGQLDDKTALLGLQYNQRATGSNQEASAQPTLTQVERRQVQTGPAQSEVR